MKERIAPDLKALFGAAGANIAYVGNNANYGVGPELFLPEYHFVTLDYSPLVDALRESGRSIFCLEEELGEKNAVFRNSANLLAHQLTTNFLKKIGATHLQLFKTSSKVEVSASEFGWKVLSSPAALSQGLENKFHLPEIAAEAGASWAKTQTINTGNLPSFGELTEEFGLPFVVQAAKSFAGNKTFFIDSEESFASALAAESRARTLKVTRFVQGLPVTVNGCVTSFGTIIGLPVVQITGVSVCTANPLGSCGNDLTFPTVAEKDEINRVVSGVGQALANRGYRGIFGVDLVMSEKGPVLIELNPRTTASLPLHTALQIERGETPLYAYHMAEFLGVDLEGGIEEMTALAQRPLSASSLVLYNTTTSPVEVTGSLKAGVYRESDAGLQFVKNGISVADCENAEEFFISPAGKGKIVNHGIEYARIYFRRGILHSQSELVTEVVRAVDHIKKALL